MIENPVGILDKFVNYILTLLDTEIMYLKPIDVLLMAGFMVGVYHLTKYFIKTFKEYAPKGVKIVYKPFVFIYVKTRESQREKRICHTCKNPLYNCTCPTNRGVSYKQRVKKWKITEKGQKNAMKQQSAVSKEANKPVVLKTRKKHKGGN